MDQPTEQAHNREVFETQLATLHPGLWKIHQMLEVTKVNPIVVPFIIEKMHEVATTNEGHGHVQIYIGKDKVSVEAIPRTPKRDFEAKVILIEEIG